MQVAGLDAAVVAENRGALDAVLELANISRPLVLAKPHARLVADRQAWLFQVAGEPLQKEVGQRIDIFPSRAKRWNRHGKDIDAEEEILSKSS